MSDTKPNELSESIANALLWSVDRCQPKPLDEANIKLAAAHIRSQSARIAALEKLVREAMPMMTLESGRWLSAAREAVGEGKE